MNEQTYSTVDRLSSKAKSRFANVSGNGLLTAVVILSGVLSAIFFWQNSTLVFRNVWPPLALILGLAVGLIPAEGAFFGWKAVRAGKADMTRKQLSATATGLTASVACSIFSTLALFVASFEYVPAELAQYDVWLVFLALSLPVVIQVAIYAYFTTNERSVVENHQRAQLGAMGFDAWIHAETARMQSVIDGMEAALNRQLETYGGDMGQHEADRLLSGIQLLDFGKPQGRYQVEFCVSGEWLHLAKLYTELDNAKKEADRLQAALQTEHRVIDVSTGSVVHVPLADLEPASPNGHRG